MSRNLLRCMSPEVARLRHPTMSVIWSLLGVEQTLPMLCNSAVSRAEMVLPLHLAIQQ
jgi:hypothetical protein